MPEISAFSLQAALTSSVAFPLENAGNLAEPGSIPTLGTSTGNAPPAPSFDALLALQTVIPDAAAEMAGAMLPESGKPLPDAANRVAALPQAGLVQAVLRQSGLAQTALPEDAVAHTAELHAVAPHAILLKATPARAASVRSSGNEEPERAQHEEIEDEPALSDPDAALVPVPDIALFAAIFAAPDRLAPVLGDQPDTAPQAQSGPKGQMPAGSNVNGTVAAAAAPAMTVAVAAAIAGTAQIELVPANHENGLAPAAMPTAITVARAAPALPTSAEPVRDASGSSVLPKDIATAPDFRKPTIAGTAEPSAPSAFAAIIVDTPLQSDTQPVSAPPRSEGKAERIDFATLVDTLNRAREDASPRSLNVAVTNTDFGRVSMRFDSSDAGLSVAMSAADPGFVRAVSASSEAAATSSDTRGQNGQAPADARAQASTQASTQGSAPGTDAGAARHQHGQNTQQQQAGNARSDGRVSGNTAPNSRQGDDAATGRASGDDRDIYA